MLENFPSAFSMSSKRIICYFFRFLKMPFSAQCMQSWDCRWLKEFPTSQRTQKRRNQYSTREQQTWPREVQPSGWNAKIFVFDYNVMKSAFSVVHPRDTCIGSQRSYCPPISVASIAGILWRLTWSFCLTRSGYKQHFLAEPRNV